MPWIHFFFFFFFNDTATTEIYTLSLHDALPIYLGSLFDPFFTTKPMNRGSGLGLYNARLFAEKHSGAISVESQEGVGATLRVWLPLADFTEAQLAMESSSRRRRSL